MFFVLVEYGYIVVFLWVLLDQVGLPLPAAPLLLAAGVLVVVDVFVAVGVLVAVDVLVAVGVLLGVEVGVAVGKLLSMIVPIAVPSTMLALAGLLKTSFNSRLP